MPPARRISLTSRWVMGRCWASALSGSAAPMARAAVRDIRTGRGNDRELRMVILGGWLDDLHSKRWYAIARDGLQGAGGSAKGGTENP